jgi:hypothetical protein
VRRDVDIRYRPDGFEAKCLMCHEWHPLTLDYWYPKHGMVRCKACLRAYRAAWQRGKRRDEAWAEGVRECRRVTYRANREERLAATDRWRAQNRERIAAYMRDYRARNRDRLREQDRARRERRAA